MDDIKRIMIVEDDEALSKALVTAMENETLACSVVNTGEHALEKIVELRPDCILLDILLPETTGEYILQEIRANEYVKDTPVIVITNFDNVDAIKAQAETDPLLDFVVKSNTELSEVVATVKQTIGA